MKDEHVPVAVKVWGPLACFTRPEMKVERVSYEVMTPSAARGILEAISWKPEFQWQIRRVEVLNPIRHISILRNEVKSTITPATAQRWAREGGGYFADDDHTPRHTLALRDVAYVIHAQVTVRSGVGEDPAKYRDQFRRRVARGQCFHRPALGCREFVADFGEPDGSETAIDRTDALGTMLFDMVYSSNNKERTKPIFFQAALEQGILRIDSSLYRRLEG